MVTDKGVSAHHSPSQGLRNKDAIDAIEIRPRPGMQKGTISFTFCRVQHSGNIVEQLTKTS